MSDNNIDEIEKRDIVIPPEDLFKEIGILDTAGKNLNPLNNSPFSLWYKNNVEKIYQTMAMYEKKDYMLKGIYENQVMLVVAGTGAGKTVIAPKLALHTMGYKGKIVMTNPKKIPCGSAAKFAALTLDVEQGKEVGYKYRGAESGSYSPKDTKLLFATDGYIKALMVGNDPLLESYDMVILDEAHERNTNIDQLFLLLRRALLKRRSLKLMIISATINEKLFTDYFPTSHFKFARLDGGGGTNFPIKKYYLEKPINTLIKEQVKGDKFTEASVRRVCDILMASVEGDILVFLTGSADIIKGCELLHNYLSHLAPIINNETYCITLSGSVTDEHEKFVTNEYLYKTNTEQAKKYDTKASGPFKRKVVFATEVAESSITISGLKYVIDAGFAKQSKYYPLTNINALEKKYISKASHMQRRGRVGRTAPGECHCLFTEKEFKELFKDYSIPPIQLSEMGTIIIDFLNLDKYISHISLPIVLKPDTYKISLDDIAEIEDRTTLNRFFYELLDLPNEDSIQMGILRLYFLKMINITNDFAVLSKIGKYTSTLGNASLEIKRAMIASYNYNCVHEICAIGAMMEIIGDKIISIFDVKEINEVAKIWNIEYGEMILFLDIFNEFVKREYDTIEYIDNKPITIKKLGKTKSWCKQYKIKYNKLSEAYNIYNDNIKAMEEIIKTELNEHLNNNENNSIENFLLFSDTPVVLFEDKNNNIIRALLEGFFVNIAKKNANMLFTTCWPTGVKAKLDPRQSILANIDDLPFDLYFYYSLNETSGIKSFSGVTGIPKIVFRDILNDESILKVVQDCLKI